MATVALVVHRGRPEAVRLAHRAVEWLIDGGHRVRLAKEDADAVDATSRGAGVEVAEEAAVAAGADLAVSLGGDGTMLRTVELAVAQDVPVLGVNLGQLGYLAGVEPGRLCEALDQFLRGEYQEECRLTLQVEAPGEPALMALNEGVLEKTVPGHTVRLALRLSGEHFISYACDGLIVSTPTGSTAYNLSARGPILSPLLQALLVTPVSPHMLFDRSLVLEPTDVVEVEVLEPRPALLVVDGVQARELAPGAVVRFRAADNAARFVVVDGGAGFHSILKAKFRLADR
ncbi:MAG TPA: NAD(+)/NADH kinase [Acidimicrobiales bacterium]|nr:NAD(+)/NADH kinase [Acidimicrobiales bacterium]